MKDYEEIFNERYKKWRELTQQIEMVIFDEPQNGLIKNRVEAIEKKINIRVPKTKPTIEERIVYLFGKIIGFGGASPF